MTTERPLHSTPQLSQCLQNVRLSAGAPDTNIVMLSVSVRDIYGGEAVTALTQSGTAASVVCAPLVQANATDFAQQQVQSMTDQLQQQRVSDVVAVIGTLSNWLTSTTDPCARVQCGMNSVCYNGTCACVTGYTGATCSDSVSLSDGAAVMASCPGSNTELELIDGMHYSPTVQCSGHGQCMRSPAYCATSWTNATCSAACSCDAGWAGSDCSYSEEALNAAREVRGQFFTKLKEAWNLTNPSADAVAQQASALHALAATKPDEVDADTQAQAAAFCKELSNTVGVRDTHSAGTLLDTVTRLSRNAAVQARAQSTVAASRRLSTLTSHEDVARAQALSNDVDDTVMNLAGAVLKGTRSGEVPVTVSSAEVAVTFSRQSASDVKAATLPNEALTLSTGTLAAVNTSHDTVDVVLKQWNVNPYLWMPNSASVGSVVGIDLVNNGSIVALQSAAEPVLFLVSSSLPVTEYIANVTSIGCAYWNPATQEWAHVGTVVVAVLYNDTTGALATLCASVHLTSFSTAALTAALRSANLPNPLSDFPSPSSFGVKSLYVTLSMAVMFGVTVFGMFWFWRLDKRDDAQLTELRALHLILLGKITHGKGLDTADAAEASQRRDALAGQLSVRFGWACALRLAMNRGLHPREPVALVCR